MRPALTHLHLLPPLEDLQLHFISSLQALAATGIVTQTIFKELSSLVQPQPSVSSLQALAASGIVTQTIFKELSSLVQPQPSGDGIF